MYLVLDTETTGLPTFNVMGRRFPHYTQTAAYNTARIVSVCWFVVDDEHNVVDRFYALVKPDGFTIPLASQAIHGISTEQAELEGIPFTDIAAAFFEALEKTSSMVAHNVEFDFNVLASEMHRRGYTPIVDLMLKKKQVCTMALGKRKLALVKNPKLVDLYQRLYGQAPEGKLHNAEVDTQCCYMCYVKLA